MCQFGLAKNLKRHEPLLSINGVFLMNRADLSEKSEYRQVLNELYSLQKFGIKFGLNKTENLLKRLGNPHHSLRCIHIAGTNGKGSVAAMIAEILTKQNFKVGVYTSPHLVRFTERFCINGREIEPHRVISLYKDVKAVMEKGNLPTFFEVTTTMAFKYFADENVDWAVIEVGMGGRLDATNVITPEVSVITNVSMDHQEFLGTTLAAIAREKAGIIKERIPVVSSVKQPMVQAIIKTTCYRKNSPLRLYGSDFRIRREDNRIFHYLGFNRTINNLSISLIGEHQKINASVALACIEILEDKGLARISDESIKSALKNVKWPGRIEILERNPTILLDGAHNPSGAESLKQVLRSLPYNKLHLVLGIMADKDIKGILRKLLPKAETVIFTKPRYERAADPDYLKRIARPYTTRFYVIPNVQQAITQAKREADPEDLICITGSLYFAGEVKELFGEKQEI